MTNKEKAASSALRRILIISNRYPPYSVGGYEQSCKSIAGKLAERGYEIYVLTSNWKAPRNKMENGVYRILHLRGKTRQRLLLRLQHLQRAILSRIDYQITYRLLHNLSPDLVYIWNMGGLSLAPMSAAQDLGLPIVLDLGDYWLLLRYRELYQEPNRQKKKYRHFIHGIGPFAPFQFRHILVNSEVLKRHYVEAGFSAEYFTVIPRGLPFHEIQAIHHPAKQNSSIGLLVAGRLTEDKGIHLAIQTVALLNTELSVHLNRPVHLNIVGTGEPSYINKLKKQVDLFGMQSMIHFIGEVSHDKLLGLYSQHDAVLIPSVWVEPFGKVAIEAMSQGACVIASERGGPAEIITHSHDGLLCTPEDPQAMAQAVVNLIQNKDLAERISQAAICTIRERYVLDRVVDQVEAYLNNAYIVHHSK